MHSWLRQIIAAHYAQQMESSLLHFAHGLAVALAAGLLVGLERGWRDRELPDGARVAGLRTFALIGLLGGVLASLPNSGLALAAGVLALGALLSASYARAAKARGSLSITTAVAALATLSLGAVAVKGEPVLAIGAAVVITVLLDLKPQLHRWLQLIDPAELQAILQLAVVSAVVLPLLPDRGMGPYQALNPFSLWLAVVVIASLSLAGHVAVRVRGPAKGMLWTGVLGGLASSTAATLTLARLVRADPAGAGVAAASALAACAVMFVRMALIVSVLLPGNSLALAGVLILLGLLMFACAGIAWHQASPVPAAGFPSETRIFDLQTGVVFAVLLAVVAVLSRAAMAHFGATGLYTVAFISGFADVDAAAISTAQLAAQNQIASASAATAILLATFANLLLKAGMSFMIAGLPFGRRIAAGYTAAALVGTLVIGAGSVLR
jgi:uncharacterized membrane protein (DUF4010 family)